MPTTSTGTDDQLVPQRGFIAKWIFDQLAEKGLPITALAVWETADCGCRYTPDASF